VSISKIPLFQGCATALVTPFLPDGSLDIAALKCLIARQIEAGMDALVLLGTTGEPCTMSMEEREIVIQTGIEMAAPYMPIIVGTGSNDTRKAINFALQAKRLGADGQLCVTPYYNKATQQGLIRHFSAILDASNLPMILYNVPSRTGVSLTPETVEILSKHPHAAGLKEASGSISLAAELMQAVGDHFPLYCGNDDAVAALMSLGALGSISVCSNIVPMQMHALTQACLHGCFDQARSIQLSLLPLINQLFSQVNPIPVKAALAMMGLTHDILRLPLTPLEEPHRGKLKSMMDQLKLTHSE